MRNPIDIWFDFVDPACLLLMLELDESRDESPPWLQDVEVRWHPFELRPPPTPLVGIDDPAIAPLWEDARAPAEALDVVFAPPALVPWTRKAHELVAHASSGDGVSVDALRRAIARAYAVDGRDIGRVDVLVEIAIRQGLDRTETKAVLDVDRYEAEIADAVVRASDAQVTRTPTIVRGAKRLEGFHNRAALGTLLGT